MTASDHLKQATGSLGGDQIPEDLNPYYGAKGDLVDNLIERIAKAEAALAQKTRECEEKQRLLDYVEVGLSDFIASRARTK